MSASTSHNLLGNSKEKYDHNFVLAALRALALRAPVFQARKTVAAPPFRPSLNNCLQCLNLQTRVFVKTSPKRSYSVIDNERFGLVFAKTVSIISGTGEIFDMLRKSAKNSNVRKNPRTNKKRVRQRHVRQDARVHLLYIC